MKKYITLLFLAITIFACNNEPEVKTDPRDKFVGNYYSNSTSIEYYEDNYFVETWPSMPASVNISLGDMENQIFIEFSVEKTFEADKIKATISGNKLTVDSGENIYLDLGDSELYKGSLTGNGILSENGNLIFDLKCKIVFSEGTVSFDIKTTVSPIA